jgi:hypothetical protein
MADVDGFDFDPEEFRRRVPFGGIVGGTPFDPDSPEFNPVFPQPAPTSQPEPQPEAPQPQAFNPFGGEEEARTQASLRAFRDEARGRGLAVDAGDQEAYAQMQAGFGSLPSLVPEISQAQSGQPVLRTGGGYMAPPELVPNQFDDPYTKQLEEIAKRQIEETRSNPGLTTLTDTLNKQLTETRENPALKQLQDFLQKQFTEYSDTPGFSPQELAILNTQAFEPIEEMRKAAQDRSTQRTAARGFLPSSGLAELDARSVDQDFDKLRTVANRDLAVRAIDRRDQDLSTAQQIGTLLGHTLPENQRKEELNLAKLLGLTIPQGQRNEELDLSKLLYSLPRNALQDALAVVNGSPGSRDLYQGADLLARQQYLEQQQNQARWNAIAEFLAGML